MISSQWTRNYLWPHGCNINLLGICSKAILCDLLESVTCSTIRVSLLTGKKKTFCWILRCMVVDYQPFIVVKIFFYLSVFVTTSWKQNLTRKSFAHFPCYFLIIISSCLRNFKFFFLYLSVHAFIYMFKIEPSEPGWGWVVRPPEKMVAMILVPLSQTI